MGRHILILKRHHKISAGSGPKRRLQTLFCLAFVAFLLCLAAEAAGADGPSSESAEASFLNRQPHLELEKKAGSRTAQEIIRQYCARLEERRNITVCATCVASHKTIPAFYRAVDYRPVWQDPKMANELIEAISRIGEDGLLRQDYYYETLKALRQKMLSGIGDQPPAQVAADFDLLMSDALLRLSHHLFFGKLDPEGLDPNWNLERTIGSLSPKELMIKIVSSGMVGRELDRLRPQGRYYPAVKQELARLRRIRDEGGWAPVAPGHMLRPGRMSRQLGTIARRLLAEEIITPDEFSGLELSSGRYEAPLISYVKRFQARYGLNPDGIIGPKTFKALALTPQDLIDTLKVNLERARWVLHELPDEYILVNIASFKLYYMRQGMKVWRSRVQVGNTSWQTPVFKADLKYVVFHPYWNVPPSILKKEIIPSILNDPEYLEKNQMEVVDFRSRPIDPYLIDWASYLEGRRFPFIVRQKPGPENALGVVKFLFPNKHHVFIHDTPSKAYFQKDKRAFSHGCIRLEQPLKLAELLLASANGMTSQEIQEIVQSGKNKTIRLNRFLPVLVLYWTAELGQDDRIVFLEDIYGRDRRILMGLETPYSLELSPYKFIQTGLSFSPAGGKMEESQ